jgi:tetratricopeptide (TPR) repeat protein
VTGFFEHPHFPCDRYSILSSICLSILIAFGIIKIIEKKYYLKFSISVLLVVIIVLGWLSFNQIKIWNNSEALFSYMIKTLENDPYREKIYWRLGVYFYKNGKKEKAIINFEKTLAVDPLNIEANSCMDEIEYKNNNFIKSIYHLKNLLIADPQNIKAHYRLSQLFDKLNKKKEAAYHLERAVTLYRANYYDMLNSPKGTDSRKTAQNEPCR